MSLQEIYTRTEEGLTKGICSEGKRAERAMIHH
jgi:hypothetical protein